MRDISNREIADRLREVGLLYEMEDEAFKPRAYARAADGVASLSEEVSNIYKEGGFDSLLQISGVGKGIAEHLEELLEKGTFSEYKRLKKKMPVDILAITSVEGVGPKTARLLWKELKIKNLKDLERAAVKNKLRSVPGLGEKSEKKILKGIKFLNQSADRKILGDVLPIALKIEETAGTWEGVERVVVAGSIRRRKETVGDIDILIVAEDGERAAKKFVSLPEVGYVYGRGVTKASVRLHAGLDADLRIVPKESFGAALNYFTGSKEHNVALREIALKMGWKLNEYGLFEAHKAKRSAKNAGIKSKVEWRQIAGESEEDLYKKLGLSYIEPELRENNGEIEAAVREMQGKRPGLPKLIEYKSLKGDLQTQTSWTDGENSIEEMAYAAMEAGLEYIAITDHTKGLAMTGGLDEKKLKKQAKEIDKVNAKISAGGSKFRVLKGSEVNLKKDGSPDIGDTVLAGLDVVGAAVHSHFNLSRAEQTRRIIRAMENPHIDIIFHLTGRLLNRREPIELDIEEVIKAAKHTGTALEINAFPDRADIKDDFIRLCVNARVKMVINTDAHSTKHFSLLEFGIAQARRGWAGKRDIINTMPVNKFLKELK